MLDSFHIYFKLVVENTQILFGEFIDAYHGRSYNTAMKHMFLKWIMNTIAIMLAVKFVQGITYTGEWWGILLVSVFFGLLNTFIRPFIRFFTFPLLILTLGVFTFFINAAMLSLTSWISDQLALGFHVAGFRAAFWGSLLISAVSLVLGCILPQEDD